MSRWQSLMAPLVLLAVSLACCGGCQPQPAAPPPKPAPPDVEASSNGTSPSGTGAAAVKTPTDDLPTPSIVTAVEVAAEEATATVPTTPEADHSPPAESPAAESAPAESEPAAKPAVEEKPTSTSGRVLLGSSELLAGIPGEGPAKLEEIQAWLDDPRNHEEFEFDLPLGMASGRGQVVGLEANPLTRAKIELGRQLYFDPRLSTDQTISCASCHDPDEGFTRHARFGVGVNGQQGGRNSPVSYNRILSGKQFWDGRAPLLEDQAIGPIANPIEMANTHDECVSCLKGIKGYALQLDAIYGEFDIQSVGAALASFERAIVTGPSPFDYQEQFRPFEKADPDDLKDEDPELYKKYLAYQKDCEDHPMSDSAKRGREIFFTEKGNCTACHVGPNLTDEKYHNLGVGMDQPELDLGRFAISMEEKEKGAFKTPTIRNVALSAPYMHDGSIATLEEVVDWYAKGGHPNPSLSEKIKKLDLTDQDKQNLVEFMKSCTGDFPEIQRGRLPE